MVQDSDKNMPKLQYILPAGPKKPNVSPLPEYICSKASIVYCTFQTNKRFIKLPKLTDMWQTQGHLEPSIIQSCLRSICVCPMLYCSGVLYLN